MRAFLVALEIERFEVEKVYKILPLHCTLMPWFRTKHSASMMQRVCSEVLDDLPPIELVSREPALFGEGETIPVRAVYPIPILELAHSLLLARLTLFSVLHTEPTYLGAGYRPHIASTNGLEFTTESITLVRTISLVEALNVQQLKDKKVLHRIHLGTAP